MTDPAAFFAALQAHSDVGELLLDAVAGLSEVEVRGDLRNFAAPCATTRGAVFAGASDLALVYFRLSPDDRAEALAAGAEVFDTLGPDWVRFTLFRAGVPRPDLAHFARRAHAYRTTARSPSTGPPA